jgi:CDP-glycerol glycerophosphotransferase (TagB/SpsB family)
VPAPLLRTEDELAAALADPEAASAPFAARREAFVAEFSPLDDGGAATRVADAVFS